MNLPVFYVSVTEGVLQALSISHEAAHFWGGLLLYGMAFCSPFARRAPTIPFLIVLTAELINECLQAVHYGSWRIDDTLADIGWTLLLPVVFLGFTLLLPHWPAAGRRADRLPAT